MKSNNYVIIQGWMCNELELKGNDLLIFALIYGFSQDGVSKFSGGRQYISNTFNISLPTVDKAMGNLLNKHYIDKASSGDYIHTDSYWVNLEVVKKLYEGSKETLRGGSKETLPSNIDIKKDKKENNNIKYSSKTDFDFGSVKKPTLSMYDKCVSLIHDFTADVQMIRLLIQALNQFIENARESGKPFYTNNFKGKINNLRKLTSISGYVDEKLAAKIIQQTIDRGWNDFYELKLQPNNLYKKAPSTDMGYISERAEKKGTVYEKF